MPKPIGISGSRIAAILGLSEYTTPFKLYQDVHEQITPGFNEKEGFVYEPFEGNASTRFGTCFEDSICALAEQKLNIKITDRERIYSSGNRTCHIDALTIHDGKSKLVENKTSFEMAWKNTYGEPGSDKLPQYIQCQVQHNMALTGVDEAIVNVLVFPKSPYDWEDMGYEVVKAKGKYYIKLDDEKYRSPQTWSNSLAEMGYFHSYFIKADPDLQESLADESEVWWDKCIVNGECPEPKNYDDILAMMPKPVGTIVATDDMDKMAREYSAITKEIGKSGRLEKRRQKIKFTLLTQMRLMDKSIDDDSKEKTLLLDKKGKRLATFNGKQFRG